MYFPINVTFQFLIPNPKMLQLSQQLAPQTNKVTLLTSLLEISCASQYFLASIWPYFTFWKRDVLVWEKGKGGDFKHQISNIMLAYVSHMIQVVFNTMWLNADFANDNKTNQTPLGKQIHKKKTQRIGCRLSNWRLRFLSGLENFWPALSEENWPESQELCLKLWVTCLTVCHSFTLSICLVEL